MSWNEKVDAAAQDREHGSLHIANKAACAFASAEEAGEQELFSALMRLVRGQRSMAPVLNLVARVEEALSTGGPAALRSEAQTFHEEVEVALLQFERHLTASPPEPAVHWGFFSASSTVYKGIRALQEAGLACSKATVGYSEPGGEGQTTFEQICTKKEILYDAVFYEIVSKGWLDHLILGCDALDGRIFINKIGSGPLAQLAHAAGTQVEIWSTTHKMVSPETMPLFNVYNDAYDDVFEYTGWLNFGTGEMEQVDTVRCEHGAWSRDQVLEYCAKLPVPSDRLKAAILEMDQPGETES